jgi:hypothetical protein
MEALVEDSTSLDEPVALAVAQSRLLAPELIVRESSRGHHTPLPIASSDELPDRREP